MSYRHLFKVLQWGLILFCLCFAMVGGTVAERLLELLQCQPQGALGCSPGSFDPFSSPCMSAPGFWAHRLALYVIPLAGPLLAPVWLVMAFWDVLLAWALLTVAAYFLQTHLATRAPQP